MMETSLRLSVEGCYRVGIDVGVNCRFAIVSKAMPSDRVQFI
jgi:hypothetical protein